MSGMASQALPVTMLSGFLGAGKTTVLRHILQNTAGLKIGCIINDVAEVNIDAKLVRNDNSKSKADPVKGTTRDLADTIELSNGCACCSIQDELFASFQQLLDVANSKGTSYDRIVLENSGVAEPQNIRDEFNKAEAEGHPLAQRVKLDTLVTVVDSGTFIKDYSSRAPMAAREGGSGSYRPVVDLLVEQIECADYIILNKTDLLDEEKLESLKQIVHSLNPLAQVFACKEGVVPVEQVFGVNAKPLVSMSQLNIEGQHRGAVAAAEAQLAAQEAQDHQEGEEHHHHDGKHDHHHHDHDHKHDHTCTEECKHDDKHDDKHDHHHDHTCTEECKHDGKHDHHHDHKHSHKKERQSTSAAKRFGIRSFVYRRRRPFHPQRLREMVLRWLPVSTNTALQGTAPGQGDSPMKMVLRSKGFMWMASEHSTAYYWSHAGQHFEIRDEGDWWAAVADEDWPENTKEREVIVADFDLEGEYGDRRQEIVFIGANMDQEAICSQLDTALLTDEEVVEYGKFAEEQRDPAHPDVEMLRQRKRIRVDA